MMRNKLWLSWGLLAGILALSLVFIFGQHSSSYAMPAAPDAPDWELLPDMPQAAGDGAAFVLSDTLYYAGGWDGQDSSKPWDAIHALELESPEPKWTASAYPESFPPRFGAAVAMDGERAYIVGGWDGESALKRVDYVDATGWYQAGQELPQGLNFPAAAIVHNRIYVTGGLPGYVRDVWSAEIQDDGSLGIWRSDDADLEVGLITRMAASGSCLYVVGGRDGNFDRHREIYKAMFDEASDWKISSWERLVDDSGGNLLPSGLVWHNVAVDQNILYVLGGETDNGVNDNVLAYTIGEDCTLTQNDGFGTDLRQGEGRERIAVASRFGEIYVLGGDTGNEFTKAAAKLVPPDPELVLHKSAQVQGDVDYGKLITYTLDYTNPWIHPDGQTGVVITDTVPDETTFVSASAGGEHITSTDTVRWDLGALAPNATGEVEYTVRIESPDLAWELDISRSEVFSLEKETWFVDSEFTYVLAYTPTATAPSEGVLVTGTLPSQLYPKNRRSIQSSVAGSAVGLDGQQVLWRIPGSIAQPGYLTVTTCVTEAFSAQELLTYYVTLQDILSQTHKTHSQAVAPGVDGNIRPSCTDDTLQLGYDKELPVLLPNIYIQNQAWICSNELSGCQSSNEVIVRRLPPMRFKIRLPLLLKTL
jgi:uncharacterized repeat protein (TIGR01451 family)